MRFRKKPVEIEAFQALRQPSPDWFMRAIEHGDAWYQGGDEPYYTIKTLEGEMRANRGDWIVRGVKGELYPVRDDVFQATHEAVE